MRRPPRASTPGRGSRSRGSSTGWTSCQRSRTASRSSPSWGRGEPMTRRPPTATARAGCWPASPGAADPRRTHVPDAESLPPGVDPTRPSPARLYDYYLGGTHNLEVDRQAAEQIRQQMPELSDAAWANRGFHGRAAVWMAAQAGIAQFIDIGSGLPTQNNTHQAVHNVVPDGCCS